MNRKIREWIKTAVIAALTVNAVLLANRSEAFSEFLEAAPLYNIIAGFFSDEVLPETGGTTDSGETAAVFSIRPICIAVVPEQGMRCGAQYSAEELSIMYENTIGVFREALGSSRAPEQCTDTQWWEALQKTGVYYDYGTELPISALEHWLGISSAIENSDSAASFIAAIEDNGEISLYYSNSSGYFVCGTDASEERAAADFSEFLPNGAYYAFEGKSECAELDAGTMIIPELYSAFLIETETASSFDDACDRAAKFLEIRILAGASYTEKDGTNVLVGSNGVIRLNTNGSINCSSTSGNTSDSETLTAAEMIEKAYSAVVYIRGDYYGSESLRLISAESLEDGAFRVNFGYYEDGIEIIQKTGTAASVFFENGRIVSLDVYLKKYTVTDESKVLLPPLQAAAIAGGVKKKSTLVLRYYDNGDEKLAPVWTAE